MGRRRVPGMRIPSADWDWLLFLWVVFAAAFLIAVKGWGVR